MAAINRSKGRLRLVLLIALGLGACSALLSGSLGTLADQQPHPVVAAFMS